MVSHEHYSNSSQAVHTEAQERQYASNESASGQPSLGGLNLPPINENLPLQERPAEAMRLAQEAFTQTSNWIEFFRETLGVQGVVRKLFKTMEEMQYFEESHEHGQIQEMLTALRSQDTGKGDTLEPQRMITVRLPKSLHEYLRVQAEEHELSINKLCISKLLQTVDDKMVPEERGGRRGRRPGPQGPRKKKEEEVVIGTQHTPPTYGSQTPYQASPERTPPSSGYQHPQQRPHFG
ncbi:MAG: toxin-antitoxin system HicB family antitoxin [Pirellulaceae bacterium]